MLSAVTARVAKPISAASVPVVVAPVSIRSAARFCPIRALNAVAANVSFVEIETNNGHDSFLLEEPVFFATIRGFLNAAGVKRGLKG